MLYMALLVLYMALLYMALLVLRCIMQAETQDVGCDSRRHQAIHI